MKNTKSHMTDPFDELLRAAIEDPSKRYHFYKSFLDLEVVVIGTVPNDGEAEGEELELNLKYIEVDNELVLPVYTSWEKFHSIFAEEYPYIKIPADMLLEMVEPEHPWVLNPGFDLGKKLIPEEIQTLKDRRILKYFFEELSEEDKRQLLTEEIIDFPEEAMEALSACMKAFPPIKKAYLINLFDPSAEEQSFPLIGLETEPLAREKAQLLVSAVFQMVNQVVEVHPQLEIALLDENLPMTNSIVKNSQAFYVRDSIEHLESLFH